MSTSGGSHTHRCAFVAVLGAPNAGKSTLVNQVVGAKVSIVSHKVQTTRFRVRGIVMRGDSQLVFIDTPGIFKPKQRLERAMVDAAWSSAADGDEIVVMVDARKGATDAVLDIVEGLKNAERPATLVLNKIDDMRLDKLLGVADKLNQVGNFEKTFMISALTGDGVDDLVDYLAEKAPLGPWMFPDDEISDLPMRMMAAEVTREEIFHQLHQELPYATTVTTEKWEDKPDGSVRIQQLITVQRSSQKGIVIGKRGSRLKDIGEKSRVQLEELFGAKVHLFLHVRVQENLWDDREHYEDMGLNFDS